MLRKAIAYLAKAIPKSERDMPAVTTAAEALRFAAAREIAWVFLARIVMLLAIHRHEVRQFNPDAKEHHWGKKKPNGTNDQSTMIGASRAKAGALPFGSAPPHK